MGDVPAYDQNLKDAVQWGARKDPTTEGPPQLGIGMEERNRTHIDVSSKEDAFAAKYWKGGLKSTYDQGTSWNHWFDDFMKRWGEAHPGAHPADPASYKPKATTVPVVDPKAITSSAPTTQPYHITKAPPTPTRDPQLAMASENLHDPDNIYDTMRMMQVTPQTYESQVKAASVRYDQGQQAANEEAIAMVQESNPINQTAGILPFDISLPEILLGGGAGALINRWRQRQASKKPIGIDQGVSPKTVPPKGTTRVRPEGTKWDPRNWGRTMPGDTITPSGKPGVAVESAPVEAPPAGQKKLPMTTKADWTGGDAPVPELSDAEKKRILSTRGDAPLTDRQRLEEIHGKAAPASTPMTDAQRAEMNKLRDKLFDLPDMTLHGGPEPMLQPQSEPDLKLSGTQIEPKAPTQAPPEVVGEKITLNREKGGYDLDALDGIKDGTGKTLGEIQEEWRVHSEKNNISSGEIVVESKDGKKAFRIEFGNEPGDPKKARPNTMLSSQEIKPKPPSRPVQLGSGMGGVTAHDLNTAKDLAVKTGKSVQQVMADTRRVINANPKAFRTGSAIDFGLAFMMLARAYEEGELKPNLLYDYINPETAGEAWSSPELQRELRGLVPGHLDNYTIDNILGGWNENLGGEIGQSISDVRAGLADILEGGVPYTPEQRAEGAMGQSWLGGDADPRGMGAAGEARRAADRLARERRAEEIRRRYATK